jgi:hypothetical protein
VRSFHYLCAQIFDPLHYLIPIYAEIERRGGQQVMPDDVGNTAGDGRNQRPVSFRLLLVLHLVHHDEKQLVELGEAELELPLEEAGEGIGKKVSCLDLRPRNILGLDIVVTQMDLSLEL